MGQTILEINGIRYDASTGRVIDPAQTVQPVAAPTPKRGVVMDLAPRATTHVAPKPAPTHQAPTVKRQLVDGVRPQRTAKSKTLMRHVVTKPLTQAQAAPAGGPTLARSSSYQGHQQSMVRTHNAMAVPKHSAVSRFSHHTQAPTPTVTHMPVAPVPVAQPSVHSQAVQAPKQTNLREQFVDSQLAKVAHTESAKHESKPKLHKRLGKVAKKRKFASFSAGAMVVLAIAGLIVYLNLPTINVALAGREAGISARIPKGIPSNFALNNAIERSNGRVVLTFDSRSDDRVISLSQQQVDATASSLSSELVEQSGRDHQVYEVGGLTLYMTGNGTADWIDGGMRYTINGNTGLSSEQIASIARSL